MSDKSVIEGIVARHNEFNNSEPKVVIRIQESSYKQDGQNYYCVSLLDHDDNDIFTATSPYGIGYTYQILQENLMSEGFRHLSRSFVSGLIEKHPTEENAFIMNTGELHVTTYSGEVKITDYP